MTSSPRPSEAGPHPHVDPERAVVLVADLGTTALKVGLVTVAGVLCWQESHDLELVLLDGGGAEQDADAWWRTFLDAAARGLAATGAADRVVAVAVTGQWSSTVPVRDDGAPAGPCYLWLDSRGGPEAVRRVGGPVAGYAPRALLGFVRRSGGAPSLDGCDALGTRWFVQTRRPEVYRATRWLLEPVDYLGMRLTGRACATQVSMVGAWLTDNREPDPAGYDPRLVALAGVDPQRLPPLARNGSVQGPLLAEVAGRLGLPPGVVVVAGMGDAHATALGSGAVGLYEPHLSLGTTSWVSCHVPAKKTDVLHSVASVPSTLPDRYLVLNNHETSGRCLHWLRDLLADPAQPPGFDDLDALASTARPGSGGVIFTPWLAGERTPVADRFARGGLHNLGLSTTRADLVRAVLEGVAYNDRWTLDVVERFTGRRLDRIRMVGGGAASDLWCQLHADVLDRTIEQVEEPRSVGLRGAALGAGLTLQLIAPADLRRLVPVRATYRPDPQRVATYARLYAEFPRLYRRQKAMFARLNAPG